MEAGKACLGAGIRYVSHQCNTIMGRIPACIDASRARVIEEEVCLYGYGLL